jgi:transcription initiation factor TFIIE subunit alpha
MASSIKLDDPLIKEFVIKNAGDDAFSIIKSLNRGKTDEQISKKTKLKVNDIRANLNRLHYMGIITYSKEKAKESNWYTYTWFVKKERITELLFNRYKEELGQMEEKLGFEQNYTFFKCSNGCDKLPFELAFEYDFKCPECGNGMEAISNDKERKKVERKIKLIRKFLDAK